MRKLLQSETDNSYQKLNTKCDRDLLQSASDITKCDRLLLQSVSGITKCDRLLLQSVTVITKWDVAMSTYILFMTKLERRGRPFLEGAKRGARSWDYPQEHLVIIRDENVPPFVKFEIILPFLFLTRPP